MFKSLLSHRLLYLMRCLVTPVTGCRSLERDTPRFKGRGLSIPAGVLMGCVLVGLWGTLPGCSSSNRQGQANTKTPPQPTAARGNPAAPLAGKSTAVSQRASAPNTQRVSMAYPTGDPATSVIGIVKTLPREALFDEPFTYEIEATNLTNLPLQNVVISDKPVENLTIRSSAPRGHMGEDGTVSWAIGTVGPRESKTVRVTAVSSGEGAASTCATVSYNSSMCTTVNIVQPKLLIAMSGPAEVLRCDDIVYQFRVTNTGIGTVSNVRISDSLPEGLMTAEGRNAVEFEVGTLGPDQTQQYTARLKAAKTGRFAYKATVTGSGGLSVVSNQVTTEVREPELKLEYTGPKQHFIGRNATYEVIVTNTGDGQARQAILEHSIPTGAEIVSISSGARQIEGKIRWDLGNLDPGQSQTHTLTVRGIRQDTVRFSAVATAYCASAVSSRWETVYKGIPAILLEVVDLEDPTAVGQNQTYVITATNQGSAPGTNINIVCTLEDNMEFLSANGATSGNLTGQTVKFAPLGSLPASTNAEWRVVVKAVKPGDVRFKVSMTSDQLNRPVEETEATNMYE